MGKFPPDAVYEAGLLATDFDEQFSVALPGSQEPGYTAIYKNAKYPGQSDSIYSAPCTRSTSTKDACVLRVDA